MLADCAPEITSMISCMLRFAPADRLSATDLLQCVALSRFHNEAREPVAPAPVQMPLREHGKYRAIDYRGAIFRNVIDKINLARNRAALDASDSTADGAASTSTSAPASPASASATADDGSSSHEPTPNELADDRPRKSKKSKHKRLSGKPTRRPSKLASAVTAGGEEAADDAPATSSSPATPSTPTSQSPRQLLEESLSSSQKKALNRGVLLGVQRTVTSPRQTVKQRLTPFEEMQVQLEELQVKRVLLEENVEQLERTYGSGAKTREQLEVLMALGLQIGDIKEQIGATEVRIKNFETAAEQEAAAAAAAADKSASPAKVSPAKSSPTLKKRHIPEQTKRLSRQMEQFRPMFAAPDATNASASNSAEADSDSTGGAASRTHSSPSTTPTTAKHKVPAVATAAVASEMKPIEREKASPRTLSALAKIEEASKDIALKKSQSQSSRSTSTTSDSTVVAAAAAAEWAISPRTDSE
jgi:hypothetical protein